MCIVCLYCAAFFVYCLLIYQNNNNNNNNNALDVARIIFIKLEFFFFGVYIYIFARVQSLCYWRKFMEA